MAENPDPRRTRHDLIIQIMKAVILAGRVALFIWTHLET